MWRGFAIAVAWMLGCAPDAEPFEEPRPVGGKADDLDDAEGCADSCDRFVTCVLDGEDTDACVVPCAQGGNPCETAATAAARHDDIAARRERKLVMVHRGSWALAEQNTLEAYRASLQLGADGNEIDVRRTADGRLVMFHDDFLDGRLLAVGDISETTWDELSQLPWRDPGPFGAHTKIPSLVETLVLHQRMGGLVHLDLKVAGTDEDVVALLDALDMFDHVQIANEANADAVRGHADYRPIHGMTGLTEERRDLDPSAIEAALASAAAGYFVDDPRPVLAQLGRTIGDPSSEPVDASTWDAALDDPGADAILEVLRDAEDWDAFDDESPARVAKIRDRAQAAIAAGVHGHDTPEILAALRDRVVQRSLHPDWRWHALDGKEALAALVRLRDPDAVDLARDVLFVDDEAIVAVAGDDAAWFDWRMERYVFEILARRPGPDVAALAREYLALSGAEAQALGLPVFESAAVALLVSEPDAATATELLAHPRREVTGRTRLELVALASAGDAWAQQVLAEAAPEALAWIVDAD